MTISNRVAAFLWGFTVLWWSLLILFTWVLVRDGPPEGYSAEFAWGLMAVFWLGGAGLAGYALNRPCTRVTAQPDAVSFTWQYPLRRVRKEFATAELAAPVVVESRDSDGDPYFHARLALPDGSTADLAEGHHRPDCALVCARFIEAIGRGQG